jgi:hypothetical protein
MRLVRGGILLHPIRGTLHAHDEIDVGERRPQGANDFAQLAADAIAVDGAGRHFAANHVARATGAGGRGRGYELQIRTFDATSLAEYRFESPLAGETKRPATGPGVRLCGR